MWYRIELNKDRSVRTCVEVSGSINEGRSVHYVEADSKASAIGILIARYTKSRDAAREYQADKRRRFRAENKCEACGKDKGPNRPGFKCVACSRSHQERKKAIRRGQREVKPHANSDQEKALRYAEKEARKGERQKRERAELRALGTSYSNIARAKSRALLYTEALDAFETMTPSRFRGWLVAKIAECQDKIDGKKSIADHLQAAE